MALLVYDAFALKRPVIALDRHLLPLSCALCGGGCGGCQRVLRLLAAACKLAVAEINHQLSELLRVLLLRQMPAAAKHDQPRALYLLQQTLAVAERYLLILLAPD